MKDLLRRLIQFHTVHGDEQAMHEGLDYIAEYVIERGMHVERFDDAGVESLVATVRPGSKTPKVMLAAHLDVVPAPDEMFELGEANGKLYGRGALDMKCGIAAYLQLIDDLGSRLEDYDIGLMITTDEEIGGYSGTAKLLEEGYLPKVCILPDGGDNWQIQVHSKGFLHIRLTATGVTAHGSRPWLGQNAILPLIEALRDTQTLFPTNAADSSTLNIATIGGGSAYNQVPHHAEADLDIRVMNESERPRLLKAIEAVAKKHGVASEVILDGAAGEFSLKNPYIAPFAKAITEVTGIKVTGSRTLGSGDARFFSAKGIPCVSLYPTGGGHHSAEEWIDEKAFYQFKDVLRRYLDQVAVPKPVRNSTYKTKSKQAA
jgi:succinyl-diaminopimelate desuccinylase